MLTAVTLVVALVQPARLPPAPNPEFVALFTPCEYRYTGGGYKDRLFRYHLFVPELPRQQKGPLVVWLHGFGEAGSDNVHHLRWLSHLVFKSPWKKERYPFFLLAVQCPPENPVWTRVRASENDDDMANVVAAILQRTLSEYAIDP